MPHWFHGIERRLDVPSDLFPSTRAAVELHQRATLNAQIELAGVLATRLVRPDVERPPVGI